MSMSEADRSTLSSDEFRRVIGHFTSGVTIITAMDEGQRCGATASAVTSLSLEPPMLVVCLNRSSTTAKAVADSGVLAVNILREDQGNLARWFASRDPSKFDDVPLLEGANSVPLLENALAHLECQVEETVAAGTHFVFLARVNAARSSKGSPLAYYRGEFGRLELAQDTLVYNELRERVMSGEISVGEPFSPDDLHAIEGAPSAAVYLALAKLASDGHLAAQADGRFTVRPVTVEAVREALNTRLIIELGVAEITVGQVDPESLEELRRRMEATLPLIEDGHFTDVAAWMRANAAFHDFMVGLAGSETLLSTYHRQSLLSIVDRVLGGRVSADAELNEDHRRLVEAYEASDLERAREVIKAHVERARRDSERHAAA
jgi:flavin reductase (DIM6/NTAB) family NADH-FMN oxidoreductase RutF/DNA-binding GntR family transcriptional regulator